MEDLVRIQHEVPVEDLFFSTTDAKGVITQANSIFERLSRYPYIMLIGRPHNVVRHPDMPGGAFRLVWDMLHEAKPTCGYVVNQAADGSAYWTFSTMTPHADGYLSVRARPCASEFFGAVSSAYPGVRAQELASRSDGASAQSAAELGADLLNASLSTLGYDSYADFVREVLPAEVQARRLAAAASFDGKLPEGIPGILLAAVYDIDDSLARFLSELTQSQTHAKTLVGDVQQGQSLVEQISAVLDHLNGVVGGLGKDAIALQLTGPKLHDHCSDVAASLQAVSRNVEAMARLRAEVRFAVALAELQSESMGVFVNAVVRGDERPVVARQALPELARAMRTSLDRAMQALQEDRLAAATLREELAVTDQRVSYMRQLLAAYRRTVEAGRLEWQLGSALSDFDKAAADLEQVDQLAKGVEKLAESVLDFEQVHVLRQLVTVEGHAQSM